MTINDIQTAVGLWTARNFPADPADPKRKTLQCALGVCEEAGELAHAVLKRDQGIRGTAAEHEAAMQDAIGDVVIYLMDLCCREGWSLAAIIEATAAQVLKRDWIADPAGGGQ